MGLHPVADTLKTDSAGTRVYGARFDPIPRVIHQTWKDAQVPEAWRPFQASWRRAHPGWQYRLWTDADNRRLIAEHHAWFLPVYDAFARDIQRVDAAKYFILYTHGGVYADLDCECMKPLDAVVSRGGAIVSRTADDVIDCALLVSPPRHPLWTAVFRRMERPTHAARLLWFVPGGKASYVLFTTGTRMMKRLVRAYTADTSNTAGLTILGSAVFSSRSWLDRFEPFDEPDTYVRHHYADSWLGAREQRVHRWLTRRTAWWVAAALLLTASLLLAMR